MLNLLCRWRHRLCVPLTGLVSNNSHEGWIAKYFGDTKVTKLVARMSHVKIVAADSSAPRSFILIDRQGHLDGTLLKNCNDWL